MSVDCFDGEPAAVFRETMRKARKAHKCSACGEAIRVGDRYCETFMVHDGDTTTVRRCARCELIYRHLEEKMRDSRDEVPDLELKCGHEYQERWDELPPPEIAALAFVSPDDAQALLKAGES